MSSLSRIATGLRRGGATPASVGRGLNRLYHRRGYRRAYNPNGVDIFAEDWDTLLLLNGCRYDVFAQAHDLPGRLERRQSRGSHTREFFRGNVASRDRRDTVYVTASPQLSRWRDRLDTRFHAVVDVWREDGSGDTEGTVTPETMAEYVRRVAADYPQKRQIAHFQQPRYHSHRSEGELKGGRRRGEESAEGRRDLAVAAPHVDRESLERGVHESLAAVLPTVATLLSDLPGRTVVTSDHGTMLGERAWPVPVREWGDPPGIYTEELLTVPWLVFESGEPRPSNTDEAAAAAGFGEILTEERLAELGYI